MLLRSVSPRLLLAVALLVLTSLMAGDSARACDCDGYGFSNGLGYFGWNYHRMPLRTGNVPAPPYFALHPPVYYSGLRYRPIGDSPFAYPPRRPLVWNPYYQGAAAVGPKLLENPYVEPAGDGPARGTTGQMIINPYYDPDGGQLARSSN